jgi:hypothetical protein
VDTPGLGGMQECPPYDAIEQDGRQQDREHRGQGVEKQMQRAALPSLDNRIQFGVDFRQLLRVLYRLVEIG